MAEEVSKNGSQAGKLVSGGCSPQGVCSRRGINVGAMCRGLGFPGLGQDNSKSSGALRSFCAVYGVRSWDNVNSRRKQACAGQLN